MPLNENADVRAATRSPSTLRERVDDLLGRCRRRSTRCRGRGSGSTNGSTAIGLRRRRRWRRDGGDALGRRSADDTARRVAGRSIGAFASSRCDALARRERGTPCAQCRDVGGRLDEALGDDRLHRRAGERRLAREHLVEHAAERVEIAAAVDRRSPAACSGLMYAGVPTIMPICVRSPTRSRVAARALPMPKSATTAWPSCSRMFSGLMSRWTTPCRCA